MTTTAVAEERQPTPPRDLASIVSRALDHGLARPFPFLALAAVYVLSRVPFVNNGYGTKPDAWRIALSGYWLWDRHAFYPSRLPGYPVPELSYAAVVKGGWVATNSLTIFISLIGVWFFARIVRELKLPNSALLVAGYAFTPLLWINSMNTMDYAWALTFILGCYYLLLIGYPGWAGILLGLAVGSRLPSSVFLVPFVLYLWRDGKRGEIRTFVVTVVGVALIAFSPTIWRYGPNFLNFYDAKIGYRDVIRLLAKDSLGLIGSLAVAIGIALSLPRLKYLPGDILHDKNVDVWVLAVVLVAVVFFRLPHEAAYLMSAFPFAYFLLARYFRKWAQLGIISVVVLAGFVDLTTTNHQVTLGSVRHLRIGEGMLLSNRDTMNAQLAFTHDIERVQVPENSVVIIGFVYPQFAVLNRDRLQLGILEKDKSAISQLSDKGKAVDPARRITYVWLLDYDDFKTFQAQGAHFFYTIDAGRSTAVLYHYRPGVLGAQIMDFGVGPSGDSDQSQSQR